MKQSPVMVWPQYTTVPATVQMTVAAAEVTVATVQAAAAVLYCKRERSGDIAQAAA